MRRLLYVALFVVALSVPAKGQTVTAASCSNTDIQTALNSVTSTTTMVVIPNCGVGGTTWTGAVTFTVPTGNNNLTIQGQGICTPNGTPGTSGYSISCNDASEIVDGLTGTGQLFSIGGVNNTTLFRITGLTFSSGRLQYGGMLNMGGTSSEVRFDHNHIILTSDQAGLSMLRMNGCINGVADHNLLVMPLGSGSDNGIQEYNGGSCYSDAGGWGDQTWAHSTSLGASNFFFMEDNEVVNGFSNDCLFAGRFVIRYNMFNDSAPAAPVQTHATSGGRQRGCRAWEIYNNYVVNQSASEAFEAFRLESGTGVVWGNTVVSANGGFAHILSFHSERSSNFTYPETATPGGWGYCGTAFNGTGSNWDENLSATDGHECMDNVGMGQGDLLTGGFSSDGSGTNNVTNNATGCVSSAACAWPRQALEPVYEWMDSASYASGGNYWDVNDPSTTALANNREFYVWCNASSASGCTTFDGTQGVGSGLLSARPSTCTAGVAYWATDQNTLYKCTATNTWSSYYTPYTYPHPLDTSGGSNSPGVSHPAGMFADNTMLGRIETVAAYLFGAPLP